MTIYFENESGADLGFDGEEIAAKVAEAALDQEKCPYEAEVSVTLVTDEAIHEINKEQRGIDAATDVLSFPMVSYPSPAEYDFLEEADDCFDPDTGELLLGDIVISTDHVKTQAESYGHSVLREYAFLVAHSMLHLLGYDHMVPEEAKIMEEKQESILTGLNITRE